jgi:hypothetical protein
MDLPFSDRIATASSAWRGSFFLEYVISGASNIWKQRNRKHFDNIDVSIHCWLAQFNVDLELLKTRVKQDLRSNIDSFVRELRL